MNAQTAFAEIASYAGTEQCGHCWETATWKISTDGMTDYECTGHALEWWSEEMQAVADSTLSGISLSKPSDAVNDSYAYSGAGLNMATLRRFPCHSDRLTSNHPGTLRWYFAWAASHAQKA